MPKAAVGEIQTLSRTGGPRDGEFNGRLAYVNSKLCNLWFTYELDRRLKGSELNHPGAGITANGFDPGLVPGSGLGRDYPAPLQFVWNRILPTLASALTTIVAGINPAWKSGAALAKLVTDPALANVSGRYFPSHTRWKEAPSSVASYDEERARQLWVDSERMTRLLPAESPVATQ